jgi:hypothetical protein
MSSDVVGGVDKHKTGEVAHGIQEMSVATVIGNLARSPKITWRMQNGQQRGQEKMSSLLRATVALEAMQ